MQAVDEWAAWAISTVESWPDDLTLAQPDRQTLETMAANETALVARALTRRGESTQ